MRENMNKLMENMKKRKLKIYFDKNQCDDFE